MILFTALVTVITGFIVLPCSPCHAEYINDQAPVLFRGQALFYEYGCRGCHKVNGKPRTLIGPPLDHMAKRLKPDWLYRWLMGPQKSQPRTKMPDPRFSSQQAADVATQLLQGSGPQGPVPPGNPDVGKTTLLESRCTSCHTIDGRGGPIGPELDKVASKDYPQRLFKIIDDPHALWHDGKMPIFGFASQDIWNMVAYMEEEYTDLDLEESDIAEQVKLVKNGNRERGKELIVKRGCTGCHSKIEGVGVKESGEIGSDLSAIGAISIHLLDFGDIKVPPKDRTVSNWLYNKVRNPMLFKTGLIMPVYNFNDQQVMAITTYLLSLRPTQVAVSYMLPLGKPPSAYAPQGAFGQILDKYRCLVCHRIRGKGGEFPSALSQIPDLSQEGSRVQKAWLEKFMKAPDTIRPILTARMLPLKIQDSEVDAIYAYFKTTLVEDKVENLTAAVSKMPLSDPTLIQEGEKLFYEKFGCNACHQVLGKGGLVGPDFTNEGKRLRAEWMVYYLHDPKAFLKRSVEPVYAFTDREIEALAAFVLSPHPIPSLIHQ